MKEKRTKSFINCIIKPALLLCLLVLLGNKGVQAASIKMNMSSVTIKVNETVKLSVLKNGNKVNGVTWGSSNKAVATVSSAGKVTGKQKGSSVITATYDGTTVECVVSVVKKTKNESVRYNILLLDHSKSMKGSPLTEVKKAAKKFAKKVLEADGTNYVAVVSFSSNAKTECGFTKKYSTVSKAIDGIKSDDHTNMYAAFDEAMALMKSTPKGKNIIKNVVLCSDGLPKNGKKKSSGRYTSKDHKKYQYANAAYSIDKKLKNKSYFIYALGFFHNSKGNDLTFGKRLMKDLASPNKFYIIQKAKDVTHAFDDIAEQIISVTLSDTSITLKKGNTKKLTAYLNGKSTSATWKSKNDKIATVSSNGTVTAVGEGTSTVTATVNGKTVSCKVTVTIPVTIKLNCTKTVLQAGEKCVLKATVTGSNKNVVWSSQDPSIASVDKNGVVTGKKKGTTYICAKIGFKTIKCKVTVQKTSDALYAIYFKFPTTNFNSTGETINEEGVRIQTNNNGIIEKCAAYIYRSGNYWHVVEAFKPYKNTVTSAELYAYVAYNGKTVRDASSYSRLNHFSMKADSDGIWSLWGTYTSIYYNVTDKSGKIVSDLAAKKSSYNMKIFDNLNDMKAYLKK